MVFFCVVTHVVVTFLFNTIWYQYIPAQWRVYFLAFSVGGVVQRRRLPFKNQRASFNCTRGDQYNTGEFAQYNTAGIFAQYSAGIFTQYNAGKFAQYNNYAVILFYKCADFSISTLGISFFYRCWGFRSSLFWGLFFKYAGILF